MRQWTVDAFTDRPFHGGPACVLEPLDHWPSVSWMQALARENGQPETAFLKASAAGAIFGLRWFTPTTEVDLCGHATLAAAHVLRAELGVEASELAFDTQSGRLTIRLVDGGYEMAFPTDPPRRLKNRPAIAAAISVEPLEIWAGRYLVAVLPTAECVRQAKPDLRAVAALAGDAREPGQLVICAVSDDPAFDVVDRFFAPGCGIDEDPATGSAHCLLAPLYSEKLGRPALRFLQASPGRGGSIRTRIDADAVWLGGQAVTVMEGRLRV